MSMKTKDKYKMSLRRIMPDQAPATRPRFADRKEAVDSSSSGPLNFSIAESGEQSENVYENKGQVQNVAEQGSADLYLRSAAVRCDRGRTEDLQDRSALHVVEQSTWLINALAAEVPCARADKEATAHHGPLPATNGVSVSRRPG